MAKIGSASFGPFLVDGYNLLPSHVFEASLPIPEALLVRSDGLGDPWEEHLPSGVRRAAMSHNGLYNDDALAVLEAFNNLQMEERIVLIGAEGNTVGKPFTGAQGAFGSKLTRVSSRGDLHRLAVEYSLTGQIDEGVIVMPLTTTTGATLTGTAVDNGASSAGGGVGYLELTALSGFTDVDAVIQDSPDNSVWTTLIAFNNLPAAPHADRKTVASTVQRYVRLLVTNTGTGSVTLAAGLKRNA